MDEIRRVAVACISRAVLFASLAIACVMLSLSFDPVMAFRAGAVMSMILSAILLFKAVAARGQNPKRTEVWLYLDERARPRDQDAQIIFGSVMREIYAHYALVSFGVGCGMFLTSLVFKFAGVESAFVR